MCRFCARSRPEFCNTVARLASAHPEELLVVELECMAACDDVPAVMIETDYFPQVHPCELELEVLQRLRAAAGVTSDERTEQYDCAAETTELP